MNTPKRDGDSLQWPNIFVAPDQGPDRWCALNYSKDQVNCNMDVLTDNSQGAGNDVHLILHD